MNTILNIINTLLQILGFICLIILSFSYIFWKILTIKFKETPEERDSREWLMYHSQEITFKEFKKTYYICNECNTYIKFSENCTCLRSKKKKRIKNELKAKKKRIKEKK